MELQRERENRGARESILTVRERVAAGSSTLTSHPTSLRAPLITSESIATNITTSVSASAPTTEDGTQQALVGQEAGQQEADATQAAGGNVGQPASSAEARLRAHLVETSSDSIAEALGDILFEGRDSHHGQEMLGTGAGTGGEGSPSAGPSIGSVSGSETPHNASTRRESMTIRPPPGSAATPGSASARSATPAPMLESASVAGASSAATGGGGGSTSSLAPSAASSTSNAAISANRLQTAILTILSHTNSPSIAEAADTSEALAMQQSSEASSISAASSEVPSLSAAEASSSDATSAGVTTTALSTVNEPNAGLSAPRGAVNTMEISPPTSVAVPSLSATEAPSSDATSAGVATTALSTVDEPNAGLSAPRGAPVNTMEISPPTSVASTESGVTPVQQNEDSLSSLAQAVEVSLGASSSSATAASAGQADVATAGPAISEAGADTSAAGTQDVVLIVPTLPPAAATASDSSADTPTASEPQLPQGGQAAAASVPTASEGGAGSGSDAGPSTSGTQPQEPEQPARPNRFARTDEERQALADVDEDFMMALPENIRDEVIQERLRALRQSRITADRARQQRQQGGEGQQVNWKYLLKLAINSYLCVKRNNELVSQNSIWTSALHISY